MTENTLLHEHGLFLNQGGVFENFRGVLRVTGPDAPDFLHRMTTQDIKGLGPGAGLPTAILQANGTIISFFDLYNAGKFFLAVIEGGLFRTTLENLEKFHFAEDLVIQDVSNDFRFLSIQGVGAEEAIKNVDQRLPEELHDFLGAEDFFISRERDFGGDGFHMLVKAAKVNEVKETLKKNAMSVLSQNLWDLLRAEAGHFRFGIDVNEKNLILESALADHVSRNKGCYPGQEVVERIFTYGNVAKKLVGVETKSQGLPALSLPAKLSSEGKEIGVLTSLHQFPWTKRVAGFAVVRKPHYEAGCVLHLEGSSMAFNVVDLPAAFEIKRELT